MGKEIERKFLIDADGFRAVAACEQPGRVYGIKQCYLINTPEATVRIRLEDFHGPAGSVKAVLCVKKPVGLSTLERDEDQWEMDWEVACDIIERLNVENVIDKTRHNFGPYEVDVFHGPLAGLFIAEKEYHSIADAKADSVPEWCIREVTDDRAYINSNMIGKHYTIQGEFIDQNNLFGH